MTRPIPLASPSGVVYLYACGRCHHGFSGAAMLVVSDGPVPGLVAHSLSDATDCCACKRCGVELTTEWRGGGYPCDACKPAEDAEAEARAEAWRQEEVAAQAELGRRLDLALDRHAAEDLLHHMKEISEDEHSAGWLIGLDTLLWDRPDLQALKKRAGGWWRWEEEHGRPMFLTTEEWLVVSCL